MVHLPWAKPSAAFRDLASLVQVAQSCQLAKSEKLMSVMSTKVSFGFFNACSAFPNCSQSWHFSMFVSKQRPDVSQHFREHQLVKLVESLPTFLSFFLNFSFRLCPNCYGLVWFIEDPSRGSTLAWVKGARVPRQKRKSNTICQETTYTVPQIYMLFSFRLFSACVRGYS